jgi:hypothetical protein
MKFKVTMKDPDTLHDAITDAVKEELEKIGGLDDDDRDALTDKRHEAVAKITSKWFRYSEYVTIEIDTDAQTAVVCPAA